MKDDVISRQAAIEIADAIWTVTGDKNVAKVWQQLKDLPSAQPDNQVHLCDSCKYTYPECPSGSKDVIYGNGKGNDNICACNKYEPSAQPELEKKIKEIGYTGKEGQIYIGGRLFAVRELAQ